MTQSKKIKVGIVDDYFGNYSEMRQFIGIEEAFEVSLMAKNGIEFIEKNEKLEEPLDLLILDLRMEEGSDLDLLRRLSGNRSEFRIIVLSTFHNEAHISQMLRYGVSAFLPKDVKPKELIQTLKEVYQKGHYFSEGQIDELHSQVSTRSPELHIPEHESLTTRELEVLKLCCKGLTNAEISENLYISIRTVETHRSNLLLKTGTKNTAGLVMYAFKNKLIDPEKLYSN